MAHIVWGAVEGHSESKENGSSSNPSLQSRVPGGGEIIFVPASSSSNTGGSQESSSLGGCNVDAADGASLLARCLHGPDGVWSKGSLLHASGACKACHYVHTKKGCANKDDCDFCHLPHTNSSSSRVNPFKREACKKVVEAAWETCRDTPAVFFRVGLLASSRSPLLADMFKLQREDLTKKVDFDNADMYSEQQDNPCTDETAAAWDVPVADIRSLIVEAGLSPWPAKTARSAAPCKAELRRLLGETPMPQERATQALDSSSSSASQLTAVASTDGKQAKRRTVVSL